MTILHFITEDGQTLIVDDQAGTIVCERVTNPRSVHDLAARVIHDHGWNLLDKRYDLHANSYHFTFNRQSKSHKRAISGPDNEFGLPESDIV